MAGLVPAIHDFALTWIEDVDARDKRGHDGKRGFSCLNINCTASPSRATLTAPH
jgi:hypothetical protein